MRAFASMEAESLRHRLPPASNPCRFVFNCNRHPEEQFTGFCASCLRERLYGLDNFNCTSSSSPAALKSILIRHAIRATPPTTFRHSNSCDRNSFRPALRRCKSFAGNPPASLAVASQRKSCDVRVRSTLSSLFNQEDREKKVKETSMEDLEEAESMKRYIELESHSQNKKIPLRNLKTIAGSITSLFSKKLQKWRRKQKTRRGAVEGDAIQKSFSVLRSEEKAPKSSRRLGDTQSEIALDSFCRRSCDIAPRFSLDAGRISFDDYRCSSDEPRASWDGNRSLHFNFTVSDDAAARRSDGLAPAEEDWMMTPGCSAQARDYYGDSSSNHRRRVFDRSSSSPNAKRQSDIFHWSNLECGSKLWESNSLREASSGSFDSSFRGSRNANFEKKSRHFNILGLIHQHSVRRVDETQGPVIKAAANLHRSGIGARRSFSNNNEFSTLPVKKMTTRREKNELIKDKCPSARSHFDNGLLRFYLTPTRGSRRRSGILAKGKFSSTLRLY